ncbi:RIP metalloprotease [uncultured Corynebacterium sp.]|uniref:M50 family metallopeptidase n=1 Tax=uncultured Corynebacterium sp. TaxID=159447 RepID=UPI0025FA700F|nr:site-2 protease family protein [uncultured Corynebacterium sp.]
MSFLFGVILFALGIAVTIALHEWGHMQVARACGMRVRRYFIGFGPTVWSGKRRHAGGGGHVTEYGFKLVPLGGFCDIAGMTAQDPVAPEEEEHAMWRRPWWQRIAVLSGGVAMNLLVGVFLIYVIAVTWGLPNMNADFSPRVQQAQCVPATQNPDGTLSDCSGTGPAGEAGLRAGDVITSVNGEAVETYPEVIEAVGASQSGPIEFGLERDGRAETIAVEPEMVERRTNSGAVTEVPAVGLRFEPPRDTTIEYTPLTAVPGALAFTGDMFGAVWDGLLSIPGKIPGVIASIFGAERDVESPMSVVGASRVGGEMVENDMWNGFMMMLANLNFFLALFNLLPLPPLDGGHIAVVVYEKLRDLIRRAFGKSAAGPADYTKLMPVTMAFTAVLLMFGVIVIAADVVNPIRLFG